VGLAVRAGVITALALGEARAVPTVAAGAAIYGAYGR
jgi:hypothetical protein